MNARLAESLVLVIQTHRGQEIRRERRWICRAAAAVQVRIDSDGGLSGGEQWRTHEQRDTQADPRQDRTPAWHARAVMRTAFLE